MRKTHKATVETEVTDDVICNRCGESCKTDCGYEGLFGCNVVGGYGSKHLGDMNQYVFDICEACLIEWFKSFKIDPFNDGDHLIP